MRRRRSRRPAHEEEPRAARRRAEPSVEDARAPAAGGSGPGPLARLGPAFGVLETAGPTATGGGAARHEAAYGHGPVRLQGETRADYDGGTFRTENTRVRPAEGCEGCTDDCVRVTGMLVATYRVTTTVTLPGADDFPDLTPCERRQVQDAIDTVLAPHEHAGTELLQSAE